MRRSQVILRLPVDQVQGSLILHDGTRAEVVLFVPPGEEILGLLRAPEPFLPVKRDGRIWIVARAAIACLSLPVAHAPAGDAELASARSLVGVRLRSGVVVEGELRWTAPLGRQRTVDHLNDPEACLTVHTAETVHLVVKSEIASVEER